MYVSFTGAIAPAYKDDALNRAANNKNYIKLTGCQKLLWNVLEINCSNLPLTGSSNAVRVRCTVSVARPDSGKML